MTAAPLPPLETNRKPTIFCGVDPGITGGICALIEGCPLPSLFEMPTYTTTTGTKKKPTNKRHIDERKVRAIFAQLQQQGGEVFVTIEKAQLRPAMRPSGHNCPICKQSHLIPNQGMTSQSSFIGGYELIRGILVGLGIGYEAVAANAWKAEVFNGEDSDKEAARRKAQKLYPIIASKFNLVKSHGLAEALLIAWWGKERHDAPF